MSKWLSGRRGVLVLLVFGIVVALGVAVGFSKSALRWFTDQLSGAKLAAEVCQKPLGEIDKNKFRTWIERPLAVLPDGSVLAEANIQIADLLYGKSLIYIVRFKADGAYDPDFKPMSACVEGGFVSADAESLFVLEPGSTRLSSLVRIRYSDGVREGIPVEGVNEDEVLGSFELVTDGSSGSVPGGTSTQARFVASLRNEKSGSCRVASLLLSGATAKVHASAPLLANECKFYAELKSDELVAIYQDKEQLKAFTWNLESDSIDERAQKTIMRAASDFKMAPEPESLKVLSKDRFFATLKKVSPVVSRRAALENAEEWNRLSEQNATKIIEFDPASSSHEYRVLEGNDVGDDAKWRNLWALGDEFFVANRTHPLQLVDKKLDPVDSKLADYVATLPFDAKPFRWKEKVSILWESRQDKVPMWTTDWSGNVLSKFENPPWAASGR